MSMLKKAFEAPDEQAYCPRRFLVPCDGLPDWGLLCLVLASVCLVTRFKFDAMPTPEDSLGIPILPLVLFLAFLIKFASAPTLASEREPLVCFLSCDVVSEPTTV